MERVAVKEEAPSDDETPTATTPSSAASVHGENAPQSAASPASSVLPPPSSTLLAGMDANITLWQFLLELLVKKEHPHLIQWTNNEGEFKLLDAEAVARLWGQRKAKPHMNYDKLSRALRYYYDKNIIKKVIGQKFVYRFVSYPDGTIADPINYSISLSRAMGLHPTPMAGDVPPPQSFLSPCAPSSQSAFSDGPDLSSLNVTATPHGGAGTPSPANSSCSPGSVGSSTSGVSSGCTEGSAVSVPRIQTDVKCEPSGASPRPSSTTSTGSSVSRKRKSPVSRLDSYPPANGGLKRPARPQPLDLAATSNFNNQTQSTNHLQASMLNPTLSPFAAASPYLQQLQVYMGLCNPQSPLAAIFNSLRTPVALPAQSPVQTSSVADSPPSKGAGFFQFPPSSVAQATAAAMCLSPSAALLSPSVFSLFNNPSSQYNFGPFGGPEMKTPSASLKTPTVFKDLA